MKGQSKIESFIEVLFSNVIGYGIDVLFILLVAPLFGLHIELSIITGGVAVLYGIHILKSFLYRRVWNWILMKQHRKNKAANDGKITRTK